jgi:hypothetical protein
MIDYSKVNWLVDEILTERQYETEYPSIAKVAQEFGCNIYKTKYVPFSTGPDTNIPFGKNTCTITHGTVQFCNQITKKYSMDWCPGTYFNKNVKSFSLFASHYGDLMLNNDFYVIPYAEFVRRRLQSNQTVFIKPESGMKEFTGKIINYSNFDTEINSMNQIERVNTESLCVIASAKNIDAEFRYIIANKEVITGSEYRWDNILDVRKDTLPICDELAKYVAKMEWQPDIVYVLDIAYSDKKAKIIELNAFSSSGLYACNTYKIVEAVSIAALKEFNGDID